MNNTNIAYLLTLIAGLSTLIGTIPIFIKIKNINKFIASSLSFASGVMFCISITDLIPESIYLLKETFNNIITISLVFIFLIIGVIISRFIEKKVQTTNSNSLYKLGIISMIAIIIHNIPEGIITYISTTKDIKLGISLTTAIAIHNIPEGISISIPIYYATKSKLKPLIYTLISSLSEIIGSILTAMLLYKYINTIILGIILSLTAGIMINISIFELLPNSFNYKLSTATIKAFIIGILTVLFNLFF